MKKLTTLFTLALLLITTNSALALTPYERAVALMNTINTTPTTTYQLASGTTVCLDLTTDLSREDKGTKPEQVTKLQNFLYPKYLQEPATGYFGVLTEAAVKKFQAEYANEIPTPTGYVGPLTRNIIKTLTCGTTNKTTTTTTPTSPVATNYNPSDAWWLNPAQTAPGATDPSKTTTTPTLTSTTTPPNCEQYAGKMPIVGQTYRVEQREFAKMVLNSMYSFSAEAQRDLDQMQGDIGLAPFRMGATSNNRIEIPVNTVLSYKMKTTDYNFPIEHYIGGSSHPGSGEGSIIWSISQCPGDFTSPGMITNPDVSNPGAQYSNIYGPCLSVGSQIASGVIFNSAGGPCTLEKNKTYYVNVAVISLIKSSDGGGLSIDIVDYARVLKPTVAANTMWLDVIKNRTAFYTDMRSAQAQMSAVAQARVTACRTAIGDARPDYVRTGGECSNLPSPTSIFTWQ